MSDPDLDCGDNSCLFAPSKGGMRTNGGCRCLSDLPPVQRRQITKRIKKAEASALESEARATRAWNDEEKAKEENRSLRARVAELETTMRTLRDVELAKGEYTSMYLVFSIDEALGENKPPPAARSVCEAPELDSPPFTPSGLAALIANDMVRVNDPRRARLDPDGTAKPKTHLTAAHQPRGPNETTVSIVSGPADTYVADDGTRIPLASAGTSEVPPLLEPTPPQPCSRDTDHEWFNAACVHCGVVRRHPNDVPPPKPTSDDVLRLHQKIAENAVTFSSHGHAVRVVNTADLNAIERIIEAVRAELRTHEAKAPHVENPEEDEDLLGKALRYVNLHHPVEDDDMWREHDAEVIALVELLRPARAPSTGTDYVPPSILDAAIDCAIKANCTDPYWYLLRGALHASGLVDTTVTPARDLRSDSAKAL